MLFQLPEDLRKSLAGEEKRKISPEEKKKISPPKPKVNRLGKIDDLLPEEIFPKSEQLKMVDKVAVRHNDKCVSCSKDGYNVVIRYYNDHWASVWAKKYTGDSNFIFGFSLAFKKSNMSNTASQIFNNINHEMSEKFVEKRYGRSDFMYLTLKVTTDNIYEFIKGFKKVSSISNLLDARIFNEDFDFMRSRFQYQSYLRIPAKAYYDSIIKDPRVHLVMCNLSSPFFQVNLEELKWSAEYFLEMFDFPDTPYFKKKIYEFMKLIENSIEQEKTRHIDTDGPYYKHVSSFDVSNLCTLMQRRSKLIGCLKSIYGSDINLDTLNRVMRELRTVPLTLKKDTTLDVCTYHNVLMTLKKDKTLDVCTYPNVLRWVRGNIKPDTLVSLICGDDSILLKDTLSMLESLSPGQLQKLKKPSRWRNRAFHDHVMVESFKYKGNNKSLPAELFPEPVKVGNWTYSQPRNTLELLLWGKTVMNCVGSADIYAQKVLKRKSLIILASENGKPRLTIDFNLHKNEISQIQDAKTLHVSEKELAKHAKVFLQAVEKVSGKR